MKYKTLLFDVDNTLLDFDANEAESFRHMLKELGELYTEEMYQRYHKMNCELWKRIERKEISVEEGVNSRFAILMRHYGKEVDGRHWEDVYRSYLNRGIQQMPYVHEVLASLKDRYRLYVITNGVEETQVFRMNGSGLASYFLDSFISGKIGASKPSKEFFDYVKSRIPDFDTATTLVIGDSLTSDIKGGHDAGIDTCWFTRNLETTPEDTTPTYTIHSLLEIYKVLDENIDFCM